MNIRVFTGQIQDLLCDTLIVGLYDNATIPGGAIAALDESLSGQVTSFLRDYPKSAQYGKTTTLFSYDRIGAKRIILLGLGKQEELTNDKIRALSGIAIRKAQELCSSTVATVIYSGATDSIDLTAQAVAEGAILGAYRFTYYKTEKPEDCSIETLYLVCDSEGKDIVENAVHKARIVGESVNLTRDLVNHPAHYMTPTRMADTAAQIAANYDMELSILDRDDMEKLNMKALLAVAQGSDQPPKLIVLKYNGNPNSNETVAFVGKGITFDSGGISLKPSEGMGDMKDDMAGAAAVIGAMAAIGQIKPKANIIGIAPCTENMPSGRALKPGDVIGSLAGKTIEIISTDAEGRLILADAVAYARQLGATKIIDLATLTGACVVALGNVTSGIVSNNKFLCQQLLEAAAQAGEKMWELPNFQEYTELIKSPIADLKNSGGRPGGAITAGLFIGQFVNDTPWVHIDIAGTVTTDKDNGYYVKGATGVGVRTLIILAERL